MKQNFNYIILSFLFGIIGSVSLFTLTSPGGQQLSYLLILVGMFVLAHFWNDFLQGKREVRDLFTHLPLHKQILMILFLLGFSLIVEFSIKGSTAGVTQVPSLVVQALIYIVAYLSIGMTTLWVMTVFLSISFPFDEKKLPQVKIIYYALPIILVGMVYLIAFYPGVMTYDSFSHWTQAHTHQFSNWHPVCYTWLIMSLIWIWQSPAIVALFQIVVMALFFGYGAYSLERSGFPRNWVWLLTILFALDPIHGIYSIVIWKDILYSGGLLLFSILLFNVWRTKGRWLDSISHQFLLVVTGLLIILFRNNGLPVVVVMLVLLMLTYKTYFMKTLMATLMTILIFLGVNGPLFHYLKVEQPDPNEALGIFNQQFAAVIKNNGTLTSEQRQYLNGILPINDWKKLYNPYLTDPIKNSHDYNKKEIFNHKGNYFKTWMAVCLQNPRIVVSAYLKQTSIIWQMNQPKDGYTSMYSIYIRKNSFGIKQPVFFPGLKITLNKVLQTTANLKSLFWRPALDLAFILICAMVMYLRNGGKTWMISLPILLNTGTLMVGIPAQDYRYLFPEELFLFMIVMMQWIRLPKKET